MPRAPLQRMPLAAGRGVDRATGQVAIGPQFPVEAINVYARDAKVAVRPGQQATGLPAVPWGTDYLCAAPLLATLDVICAMYDRTSGEIRIYRIDTLNFAVQYVATWGTLLPGLEYPVVKWAEANGRMFLAHAEPTYVSRLATVYYTPNFATPATVGTLATLTADLNGDGVSAPVYFAGVYTYLSYLIGWGYGTETPGSEDLAHYLRLSKSADPLTFSPENFFFAGVPRDPILDVIATENVAAVLKNESSYRLFGADFDTFGIDNLDTKYGTIGSRVTFSVGGIAYTWSSDGARKVLAAGTVPVAHALELLSPLPADLPPLGPGRLAFGYYDKARYLCEWCFPDIETAALPVPGFALSLWSPDDPRWTFFVRELPVTCVGELLFRDTGSLPDPPTGYPSSVSGSDA